MHALPRIRAARWSDKRAVAALTADALHTEPLGVWLVPDEHQRRRILTDVLEIWVEHALFFGEVHVTGDLSAAAVSFHRYRPIPPPNVYRQRLHAATGPGTEAFDILEAYLHSNRPTTPHHHLAFLAVSPEHRRKGRGGALLTHHRQRVDLAGLLSMAEVTTTNRGLYLRHGYLPQPEVISPGGIRLLPLVRPSPSLSGISTPGSPERGV
ncbi:GNAT family N-acetyltransferase [Micromonospora sp. 4G57]|uniref:GNAT family N-acetyltransferase n=1 Tax=Micromonospora sicca TaxID=2202420 RepID=A0ABU5JKA3_9ACTN|nr:MULTISPECIES: GNAT family N-acetyltransferase [unclassified Micromonospora]MDZ5447064.1 GNAT family N-acetyltransferase [Micromonospora sp. 4G57]MDZ5493059.1 GNAT family N-acetyltransferase [Micromonospora sp. 4G53]